MSFIWYRRWNDRLLTNLIFPLYYSDCQHYLWTFSLPFSASPCRAYSSGTLKLKSTNKNKHTSESGRPTKHLKVVLPYICYRRLVNKTDSDYSSDKVKLERFQNSLFTVLFIAMNWSYLKIMGKPNWLRVPFKEYIYRVVREIKIDLPTRRHRVWNKIKCIQ